MSIGQRVVLGFAAVLAIIIGAGVAAIEDSPVACSVSAAVLPGSGTGSVPESIAALNGESRIAPATRTTRAIPRTAAHRHVSRRSIDVPSREASPPAVTRGRTRL